MNVYLVSHPDPTFRTYTDFLIAADNAPEAKNISVVMMEREHGDKIERVWVTPSRTDTLKVRLLGTADNGVEKGIIQGWRNFAFLNPGFSDSLDIPGFD
jgi:hypothetical protein